MGSLFSHDHQKGKTGKGKTQIENKSNRPKRDGDEITEKDRAVLDLKNSKDRLKKYKKKLETESGKLTDQAKQHIKLQQRDRALLLLKLKRMKEQEVDKIDKQLLSVMEMIDNIEWEYTNLKVMKALQEGNQALNKLHNEMSYEDVVALLEETNEAIEVENEINELIAGQFNPVDETELQKELAELMGESLPTATAATATANSNIATPAAKDQTKTSPATKATTLDLPEAPSHPIQMSPSAATTTAEESKRIAIAH